MSIRLTGLLVLVAVVATSGAAFASGHNADLFGGYTGATGSHFKGFSEAFTKIVATGHSGEHRLDLIGDLSIYRGEEKGLDQTVIGWMGGAGWTFKPGKNGRVTLSPHVLAGAYYTDAKDGVFTVATGGAIDVPLDKSLVSQPGWALRIGGDYITRHGATPNLTRLYTGIVYRFAHQPHK